MWNKILKSREIGSTQVSSKVLKVVSRKRMQSRKWQLSLMIIGKFQKIMSWSIKCFQMIQITRDRIQIIITILILKIHPYLRYHVTYMKKVNTTEITKLLHAFQKSHPKEYKMFNLIVVVIMTIQNLLIQLNQWWWMQQLHLGMKIRKVWQKVHALNYKSIRWIF